MNVQKLINDVNLTIDSLTSNLRNQQLDDGGFKGYHLFDKVSGIWSSCEILHILLKSNAKLSDKVWINNTSEYIASHQNVDGGWGFRGNGKSITDVTAWACLSLSHFKEKYKSEIINGVRFLLSARKNVTGEDKGGWGLTRQSLR